MHRYEDEITDEKKKLDRDKMSELNREANEEMGADFAAPPVAMDRSPRREADGEEDGKFQQSETRTMGYSLGWVALVFAIASWFIWPVLLGITSAVLGFIAYRQGARKTGAWSMALGLIAAAVYLVIIPFYYAVT